MTLREERRKSYWQLSLQLPFMLTVNNEMTMTTMRWYINQEQEVVIGKDMNDALQWWRKPGSKYGVAGNKVHRRGRCYKIHCRTIKNMRFYSEFFTIHISVHVRFGKLQQFQLCCETHEEKSEKRIEGSKIININFLWQMQSVLLMRT